MAEKQSWGQAHPEQMRELRRKWREAHRKPRPPQTLDWNDKAAVREYKHNQYLERQSDFKKRAKAHYLKHRVLKPKRTVPDGMKWCPMCETLKPLTEFYKMSRPTEPFTPYCKPCNQERKKVIRQKDPEHARRLDANQKLKSNYGITLKQYEEMLERQGGVCAVCKCASQNKKRLHVDHDHSNGSIRGLLCNACNITLGLVKDNPFILRRLDKYLQNSLPI